MAWNEPGGNNKDPWGGGNRGNDGPPDLDEALKKIQKKFSALFGGGKPGGGSGSGSNSGFGRGILIIGALVLVGVYLVVGAGVVNEQERAVVLRLGNYDTTIGPGFRWNPPLIDKIYTVNVTNVRQWQTSEQMLTKDLNIVDIKLSVQYIIDDAEAFVLRVKDPEESLRQATNSALRHVAGSTRMHDVLTEGREQVAFEVQDRLQMYLNAYTTGIRIDKVNIEDSNPPRQVQGAFDEVIEAREDEERYKNQAQAYSNGIIPEARGAAQSVKEEATAYKQKVIAEAEGEAKRFEYLLEEYKKAPDVTRQRLYLDAVEEVMANSSKVLIDVKGGNNLLYLPLDKIVGNSQQSAARGLNAAEINTLTDQVKEQLRQDDSGLSSRRREGR
ncbi:FtsH protease activity modulator HflK [Teredinibacter haidensis]|uniref:FtsH protease activity modulator HflK n=1 Tax=Teredinibacter haidensis TaxID=2731755 RepID=UPI00094892B7|nr:FtsH protease activity modulator HflK [Teredinibacter haidensis]